MVGHQLPIFSVIIPFWLIWAMAGRRAMIEVWLVDVISALVSIGAVVALLQVWRPKRV